MTFIEKLQGRIGDLIKIDCKLYWGNTAGWQSAQQRFCALLDVMPDPDCPYDAVSWNVVASGYQQSPDVNLLLLIDGSPKYIALNEKDIKVVKWHSSIIPEPILVVSFNSRLNSIGSQKSVGIEFKKEFVCC